MDFKSFYKLLNNFFIFEMFECQWYAVDAIVIKFRKKSF